MSRGHCTAVVIPAYNEAATIADIVHRALAYSDMLVVVNDGSTDATGRILERCPVTVISHDQNLGKGRSLLAGIHHALELGADAVITLDADGQHRPEDIPLLLDCAAHNPDRIIIAARLRRRRVAPLPRRLANRAADFWISWAAGQRIRDSQSGFRHYPAGVFRHCSTGSSGFVFESEILIDAARAGYYSMGVAVDTLYHADARSSHYRPASDTWAIVLMVARKLICRGLYPMGLLRSLGVFPRQRPSCQ